MGEWRDALVKPQTLPNKTNAPQAFRVQATPAVVLQHGQSRSLNIGESAVMIYDMNAQNYNTI